MKPNSSSASGVYHVRQYRVRYVPVDCRLLPDKIDNILSDNIYGMTKSVAQLNMWHNQICGPTESGARSNPCTAESWHDRVYTADRSYGTFCF
jgi:hypothetical protein